MSKGIVDRLKTEGSLLTSFDGNTPPPAIFPDPLDSSNSELSGYKGITPKGYLDNPPR
jgi:hypothetical protein